MPQKHVFPRLAAWRKALVADLAPLWILITLGACVGFVANQLRDQPLPLLYASKSERLQREVDTILSRDNAPPQSPQPAPTEASLPPAGAQAGQPAEAAAQPNAASSTDTNNDTPTAQPPPFLDLEAIRAIAKGEKQGLILDARPEIFHRIGHIPNALSLPREDFETAWNQHREHIEKNKPHPLVVYCSGASCEDSLMVAAALQKLSLPNVRVFKGGWSEWTAAKLPEETAP